MLAFVSIIMGVGLSATGNVFASSLATMFPAVFLSTMVGLWISHEVHLNIGQFTYYLPATSHPKYSGCSSVRCRRPNHVWLFIGSMVSKKYVITGLGSFFLFTFFVLATRSSFCSLRWRSPPPLPQPWPPLPLHILGICSKPLTRETFLNPRTQNSTIIGFSLPVGILVNWLYKRQHPDNHATAGVVGRAPIELHAVEAAQADDERDTAALLR